jgi:hypothetical protein
VLADHLRREAALRVAVIDLDVVYCMLRQRSGFGELEASLFANLRYAPDGRRLRCGPGAACLRARAASWESKDD